MDFFGLQFKKLNVGQVLLVLTPLQWTFFPRWYRHTPKNTWGHDYGNNHTEIIFLFINLKIIYLDSPSPKEQVVIHNPWTDSISKISDDLICEDEIE